MTYLQLQLHSLVEGGQYLGEACLGRHLWQQTVMNSSLHLTTGLDCTVDWKEVSIFVTFPFLNACKKTQGLKRQTSEQRNILKFFFIETIIIEVSSFQGCL